MMIRAPYFVVAVVLRVFGTGSAVV